MEESLIYEILSVVAEIPEGKVATYGQIARLIGRDKNARLIGKVLGMAEKYGEYPCHRVVNHAGRLVGPGGFASAGRSGIKGQPACGSETISMGRMLNSDLKIENMFDKIL